MRATPVRASVRGERLARSESRTIRAITTRGTALFAMAVPHELRDRLARPRDHDLFAGRCALHEPREVRPRLVEVELSTSDLVDRPGQTKSCEKTASVRQRADQPVAEASSVRNASPTTFTQRASKPLSPSGSSATTSTQSTRAPRGPSRQNSTRRSTASRSPSSTASTAPSPRLPTQPATPRRLARGAATSRGRRRPVRDHGRPLGGAARA